MKRGNLAQRVVLSIGSGLFIYVLASALASWATTHSEDGWFNFSPGGGAVFSPGRVNGWAVLTWALAVIIWTAGSVWLFRRGTGEASSD